MINRLIIQFNELKMKKIYKGCLFSEYKYYCLEEFFFKESSGDINIIFRKDNVLIYVSKERSEEINIKIKIKIMF